MLKLTSLFLFHVNLKQDIRKIGRNASILRIGSFIIHYTSKRPEEHKERNRIIDGKLREANYLLNFGKQVVIFASLDSNRLPVGLRCRHSHSPITYPTEPYSHIATHRSILEQGYSHVSTSLTLPYCEYRSDRG